MGDITRIRKAEITFNYLDNSGKDRDNFCTQASSQLHK